MDASTSPPPSLVEFRDVTFGYGERAILDGVSFDIPRGKVTALMGASGFMTVIYAITKINYTYEIPLFLMLTLRGGVGDHHKHHASNSLYLRPVLDAIDMPYRIIDQPGDISSISRCYHHTRTFARPTTMANLDNEGIAFAPEARCAGGWKPFYWTGDGSTDGHALRADTIPCGRLAP